MRTLPALALLLSLVGCTASPTDGTERFKPQDHAIKVALDPMGDLAKAFDGVQLTPTTVLIDKHGKVVQRILGEPDFGKLEKLIEQKLAEAA